MEHTIEILQKEIKFLKEKLSQSSFKNHEQSKKLFNSIKTDYGVLDNEEELHKCDLSKQGLSDDCIIFLEDWYKDMYLIFCT